MGMETREQLIDAVLGQFCQDTHNALELARLQLQLRQAGLAAGVDATTVEMEMRVAMLTTEHRRRCDVARIIKAGKAATLVGEHREHEQGPMPDKLDRAIAYWSGKWPDQLDSGVMFYDGERISREQFEARAKIKQVA